MEQQGTLSTWHDNKGYGFITPDNGGRSVFVHISSARGTRRPQQGDRVAYLATRNAEGQFRANHMRLADVLSLDDDGIRRRPGNAQARDSHPNNDNKSRNKRAPRRPSQTPDRKPLKHPRRHLPQRYLPWLLLMALPAAGSLSLIWSGAALWLLPVYTAMSALTFSLYRIDKRHAKQQQRRIPEKTLHLTELLGGWPGALIAQYRYRHKTRKFSYQITFWLIVALHQAFWLDHLLLDAHYRQSLLPLL